VNPSACTEVRRAAALGIYQLMRRACCHLPLTHKLLGIEVAQARQLAAEATRHGGHAQHILQQQPAQGNECCKLAKRGLLTSAGWSREAVVAAVPPRQRGRLMCMPDCCLFVAQTSTASLAAATQ